MCAAALKNNFSDDICKEINLNELIFNPFKVISLNIFPSKASVIFYYQTDERGPFQL